jgi:hypothetical protein
MKPLVLALAFATTVLAQAATDLSGTWTLDPSKSDRFPPPPSAGALGAAGSRGAAGAPANQIVIRQTPAELTVLQGTSTYTYKLDGTESWTPPAETKAVAKWEDGRLVISWKREFFGGPTIGYFTNTGRDVYALTANVLTIEKTATTREGTATYKYVFTKS